MTIADKINQINQAILDNAAKFSCMEDMKAYGVAEPILRRTNSGEEWIPVLIHNSGEDEYIFVDDAYSLGFYHRLLSKTYSADKSSYGDGVRMMITADMRLVCWGFRTKLNTTADRVESFIYASMPPDVRPQQSLFDRSAVFGNEFRNVPFFLPEEVFLFSMNYKLQYSPNNRVCIDLRDICN